MKQYFFKRVIAACVALFIILTLAFAVVRLMPGSVYDDPNLPPAAVAALEKKAHLDQPLSVQYGYFLKGVILENDWGTSVKVEPGIPAFDILARQIPVSLFVNLAALLIALPIGILAGSLAAVKKNTMIDHGISFLVILGISVPSFVFASLLQYFLGFKWGLFPILYEPSADLAGKLHSLLLPIFALSLSPIATITRYLRGELIEVLDSEYMTLACTKGLSHPKAVVRHGFRNASLPLINVVIPMFANVLGGSMVIERMFSIPGVGGTMIKSINQSDYSLTVATLIFYALISVLTAFVVDILLGIVDPRARLGGENE